MKLTKDTDKILCFIYYLYLDRIESGESKFESSHFSSDFFKSVEQISNWHQDDISICLRELKDNDFINLSVINSFVLNQSAKIYMENRFMNGLKDLLSYFSLFK